MSGGTAFIVLAVCVLLLFLMFKGVVKTFKRQPIVAILCIIFLFPFYLIWVIVEMFTGPLEG